MSKEKETDKTKEREEMTVMKYEEFVEKLKSGSVYIHNWNIKPENIMAIALINRVCDHENIYQPSIECLRGANAQEAANLLSEDNIVIDIGDGDFTFGFAGDKSPLEKIYDIVGEKIFDDKNVAEEMNERFIKTFNGSSFYSMIKSMSPVWNEPTTLQMQFENAVKISRIGFDQREYSIMNEVAEHNLANVIFPREEDIIDNRKLNIEYGRDKILSNTEFFHDYGLVQIDKEQTYRKTFPRDIITVLKEEDKNIVGFVTKQRDDTYKYTPLIRDGELSLKIPEEWFGKDDVSQKGDFKKNFPGLKTCKREGYDISFESLKNATQAFKVMVLEQETEMKLENELLSGISINGQRVFRLGSNCPYENDMVDDGLLTIVTEADEEGNLHTSYELKNPDPMEDPIKLKEDDFIFVNENGVPSQADFDIFLQAWYLLAEAQMLEKEENEHDSNEEIENNELDETEEAI